MGKIIKNGIVYGGGGGGSGSGHTIMDTNGNFMPAENNLQFIGLDVTDNSSDGITEVESATLNQDSLDDVMSAGVAGTQVAGNGLVYSTTEQVVGRWINGKPIYQKTIEGTFASSGTGQDINHNIANLEQAVNVMGYLVSGGAGETFNIPVGFYNGAQYFSVFFMTTKMCARLHSSYFGTPYKITVQYTKTTD